MQNWKLKSKLTGWALLILIIIIGMLCSCEKTSVKPCFNGVFTTTGIELIFDNGTLTGQTKCNSLDGEYFTNDNYMNIDLGGTKVYCINEYKITYFRDVYKYRFEGSYLILIGNDFEIILYSLN